MSANARRAAPEELATHGGVVQTQTGRINPAVPEAPERRCRKREARVADANWPEMMYPAGVIRSRTRHPYHAVPVSVRDRACGRPADHVTASIGDRHFGDENAASRLSSL